MTTKQQNKLAMYLAVKSVLDANNPVWQPLQAFADGYTDFTTFIGPFENFAPKTCNHYRAAVRQFLQWAVRKDYLPATHRLTLPSQRN